MKGVALGIWFAVALVAAISPFMLRKLNQPRIEAEAAAIPLIRQATAEVEVATKEIEAATKLLRQTEQPQ